METVSSVTNQCVISPSLLANIDPHPDLRIGWEELLGESVDLGSEQYARLFNSKSTLPMVTRRTKWTNW